MLPPRSVFATMTLNALLEGAKEHNTQKSYLRSLGFKKTYSLGLTMRMKKESISIQDLWPNRLSNDVRTPESHHVLDVSNELHDYFYGLSLADDHLREENRGRGNLTIELKEDDASLLGDLESRLPWKGVLTQRTRDTNFKLESRTATLRFCSRGLRGQMVELGFPVGKKSFVCAPPNSPYHEHGFWRSMLDGDGSLGYAKQGHPFVSFVSSSETMVLSYLDYLARNFDIQVTSTANARDGVWNPIVSRESAVALTNALYPGIISLPRKAELARQFVLWQRK